MSQKPETKFRARVDRDLKKLPNSWWESLQQKTIIGSPDKIGCVNGWFIGLELKASASSRVGELQQHKLTKITEAGGFGLLAFPENWEKTFQFLEQLAHGETRHECEDYVEAGT
jgi:hypothetical protein